MKSRQALITDINNKKTQLRQTLQQDLLKAPVKLNNRNIKYLSNLDKIYDYLQPLQYCVMQDGKQLIRNY